MLNTGNLQVPRKYLDEVKLIAAQANAVGATLINLDRAVVTYHNQPSNPVWLLDLRRSRIPYVWFWGTPHQFQYIRTDMGNALRTNVVHNEAGKDQSRYLELSREFRMYEFNEPSKPYTVDALIA